MVEFRFTFHWNESGSGSGKMMPIQPDPDTQHSYKLSGLYDTFVNVSFLQKYIFWIIRLRSDFVSKCAAPRCHTTDALSLSINTIIIYIFIYYEQYSEIPCKKQCCGSGSNILSEFGYGSGYQSNPDPGFWWPNNWRKKIKDVQAAEAFSTQKKTSSIYKLFSVFCGLFLPSWIQIQGHRIRIKSGSRSTTLLFK